MITLLLILPLVYSGTIYLGSISNTIANKNQYSDYTFVMTPETNVPPGGQIQIQFPIQYDAFLGGKASCVNCSIQLHIVTFYFTDAILSVANTLKILNVLNPPDRGGTSNFIVRTMRNEFIFDENLIFSTIGIADDIKLLSSTLVSSADPPTAGALSKYNFAFKTNTNLPKGTTFQLFIPKVFAVSANPSCGLFPINGVSIPGDIVCKLLEGNKVQVTGFTGDIGSGSEVGIQVSLTNPLYSQVTDKFTIAAYREGTSVIYTWKTEINSVQILPGVISEISLTPLRAVRQATGKTMDYSLSFLPSNPLPKGGYIKIEFPATFPVATLSAIQYVFLKQGLDDVSESVPLKYFVSSSEIRLYDFNATNPQQIQIYFRAINPSSAGKTTPLTIRTYTDSTMINIIDENKADATTTIELIPSLTPTAITIVSDMAQQQNTDLTFTITPNVVIPSSAIIKVLLENAFTVGAVSAANCLATLIIPSIFCNKSDNLITWQNPNNVQYNVAVQSSFKLINLIQTPVYARTYLVDIEIYTSAGVLIQTYSNYIDVKPYRITLTNTFLLNKEVSTAVVPKYSILHAQFTNAIVIPAGGYDSTNKKSYGRIEILFLSPTWDTKLGTTIPDTGEIPCKAINGLLPIDGLKITCNLYYGSALVGPKIIMRNFQEVLSGTVIIIHIPKILTPIQAAGTTNLNIQIVQYDYRWKTILNEFQNQALTLLAQAGSVPGTAKTTLQISNYDISHTFNCTFELMLGNDLLPNSHFLVQLPGYDTMFVPYEDTVVCYIDTYLTPCITYPGVDWILLYIQPTQTHFYLNKPNLLLYNLVWPRYQDSVGKVKWIYLQAGVEKEIKTLGHTAADLTFSSPVVKPFDIARILSPKKGKGSVGLNFEFYFRSAYLIPTGGAVVLTFPVDFSLDGSYPQAVFQGPQFKSISATQPLSYLAVGNVLKVYNILEHPASGPFTIKVNGIKTRVNPTDPNQAYTFNIQSEYNGKPINLSTDFDRFTYGSGFNPGMVIFDKITAFPSNQLEYATYTLRFILTQELLQGGEISVTFPSSHYPYLPTPSLDCVCSISGGLTSFKSCRLQGYSYIVITDQVYRSGQIAFTVTNILNPQVGYTAAFTIKSKYDGTYLDLSDDNLQTPRKLLIYPKAQPVLMQSIDFYPRNEGEEATYIFTFVPSSYILKAFIVITFPLNYDALLGNQITCQLYDCEIVNRQLWVSGVNDYLPLGTNPIVVTVQGVVNPNRDQNKQVINQFSIGVILQNTNNYVDYNPKAGQVTISPAPGWAQLYQVIPSNLYSRWANTGYFLNITTLLPVPKTASQGSVIIDFPQQFDIPNGNKPCTIIQSTFATTLKCNSKTNSITVQGQTEDKNGIISFNVTGVANPPDEVTIDNILIKTYDGFKKEIVEKSYKNLDPWTFSYKFPGPLITINNDEVITVERGTQTKDMWFRVQYPCALNLVFQAITDGFTIMPEKVLFSLTDLEQKFRVSVPEDFAPGTYTITWVVSGELSTPYYTPVKKSVVKITNNGNIRINIQAMNEVPIGGNSLDTLIQVDYAPNLGIEILLTSMSTALTLSSRSLQFVAGQNNATFRVYCNDTIYNQQEATNTQDSRSIVLTLSGINKDVFLLSQSVLEVTFISQDTEPPFITGLIVDKSTQTQTDLIVSAGEISIIYYMIALRGTKAPEQKELTDLGPAQYQTTESQYGKISIGKTNTASVRIRNLRAQTPYVVYGIAEDRGGRFSDVRNFQFQTLDRFNASLFSLTFKQSYLNQAEKDNIRKQVAFVLSLPVDKVIEKVSASTSRILQASSIIQLYLISIPTIENFSPPLVMVGTLRSRIQQLNSLVSNLDTSVDVVGIEFEPFEPEFIGIPQTVAADYTKCTVQGKLMRSGGIFIESLQASQDTASPLPVQVWWGYNNLNIVLPHAWVKVELANTYYNITIDNLQEDTDYNIYMIAGSSHPGYPDIPATTIHLVACKTLSRNAVVRLDINQQNVLGICILILLIMLY